MSDDNLMNTIPEPQEIQAQPAAEQSVVAADTGVGNMPHGGFPKQTLWMISFGFLLLVSVFISLDLSKSKDQRVKAGNKTVTVSVLPSQVDINPEGSVQLWVNANSEFAFLAVDIMFDPSLLQLRENVSIVTTKLQRIVQNTPYEEANKIGKATVVLGLEPSSISGAPSGTVHIATLAFRAATQNKIQTPISIVPSTLSIIHTDTTLYTVTIKNSEAIINGGTKPTEPGPTVLPTSPVMQTPIQATPTSPIVQVTQQPTNMPTGAPTPTVAVLPQTTPTGQVLQPPTATPKK